MQSNTVGLACTSLLYYEATFRMSLHLTLLPSPPLYYLPQLLKYRLDALLIYGSILQQLHGLIY